MALAASLGCRETPPGPPSAAPTPAPLAVSAPSRVAPVASIPPPPPAPTVAPDDTPDLAALTRAFHAASDAEARGTLAGQLWEMNTPDAVATLHQLFLRERDPDVRTDLLAGLGDDPTPETRETRYRFLLAALAPAEPKDTRALALELLREFEDIRAVATLQSLATDADPDIRAVATELLAERPEKQP